MCAQVLMNLFMAAGNFGGALLKLQQLFKIAAEIIRTAAFEHGAHKKNIIFVKLLHLYPPLSAVENSRSYLPDYFIILNDAEFSGKETAGIHQLVIIL